MIHKLKSKKQLYLNMIYIVIKNLNVVMIISNFLLIVMLIQKLISMIIVADIISK